MTVYIEDTKIVTFLEQAKDILIDNPGMAPMNDLFVALMETLDVAPVSAEVDDMAAFASVAERTASDARLSAILDTRQYFTTHV